MIHQGDILLEEGLDAAARHKQIDLQAIVPLGALQAQGCTAAYSLDGQTFEPLSNQGAGVYGRFIRLELTPGADRGWAQLRAGSGFIAQAEPYWTDVFTIRGAGRRWRGADGVYSLVVQNAPLLSQRKVLFTFGDTLISGIAPGDKRTQPLEMVNNSYAILQGEDPAAQGAFDLRLAQDKEGKFTSLLSPQENAFDYAAAGLAPGDTYYWMQDWARIGQELYTWPMLLTNDPEGPEGYQFRLLGTSMISIPLAAGEPDFAHSRQMPLNLYSKEEGREILYGGGVLRCAGQTVCDGFVYLYGYITTPQSRALCLSRVRQEDIARREGWTFFDGQAFVPDIKKSAPLLEHVSTELSVTLLEEGPHKGKYLAVFQYDTNSAYVAISLGDSPTGPFSPAQKIYRCPEAASREGTYTYNAKAHTPLSLPGKIIASYNVNSTHWQSHLDDALLYHPRFIQITHTAWTDWDMIFSDTYRQRCLLFDWLNQRAAPGGAVFAGDSLIHEYPLEEAMRPNNVYNRGIGGDTAFGLERRLAESVLALKPRQAFLLIGTNDLAQGTPPQEIAKQIVRICEKIRAALSACQVYVISLLPVNAGAHPKIIPAAVGLRSGQAINEINTCLQQAAPGRYTYIDAHSRLADAQGALLPKYTKEGLHIAPEGYAVLSGLLRPLLET